MAKCRYCDGWSVSAGGPCQNSPIETHIVDDGPNRCIYCDLNYASSSAECRYSPCGYHTLGTKQNTPLEHDSATPFLIWFSIITVFVTISIPILYIFDWSIQTSLSKAILGIFFLISSYIGFKFVYRILKVLGVLLITIISIFVLYYLFQY